MRNELEPLYEMIDKLEIAMMTTRRPDGHLESRAMATQRRAEGADLWTRYLAAWTAWNHLRTAASLAAAAAFIRALMT